jgi:hypothetical protein
VGLGAGLLGKAIAPPRPQPLRADTAHSTSGLRLGRRDLFITCIRGAHQRSAPSWVGDFGANHRHGPSP